ncbi:MAG: AsmA family protein [Alphaproteobacteria bacterium]
MQRKIKISAIIILIVLIIISLPNFFNLNNFKAEISKQIYNNTNCHMVIEGDIKLFFLPNIQLKIKDAKIFKQLTDKQPIFKVGELQASVKILPLLRKKIEVDKVTLKQGVLNHFVNDTKSINLNNIEIAAALDNRPDIKFTFENNDLEIKGNIELGSLHEFFNQNKYDDNFTLKFNASKKHDNLSSKINVLESYSEGRLKYIKSEPIHIDTKIKINNADLDILTAHNIYTINENKNNFFKKISLTTKDAEISKNDIPLFLNADIEANNTVFNSMLFKYISLTTSLEQSDLKANLNNISLYDGSISGIVNIRKIASNTPHIEGNVQVKNIGIDNLFSNNKLLHSVKGKANIDLKFNTHSYDPKLFKANLNGEGHAKIDKGEIDNLSSEFNMLFLSLAGKNISKILFDSISASFGIQHGIISNNDLKIVSDIAEFSGNGSINLNNNVINYKILPIRIFEQNNKDEISLKIRNTIDNPKYTVDLNKMIGNKVKDKILNKLDLKNEKVNEIRNSIEKFLELGK